ncbi:hypothetical protein [Polyangium sorediatum]|uniref:Uncharacterized protein n=1 Tax=Polyangium sorediatum TaxID=889274 RepID=A0ABT6NPJ3_9BACT|nr:hypothetical protein [Polyangium sorediatum]MDI1430186.1 hypothetical protein [Polyangium sorediatum]
MTTISDGYEAYYTEKLWGLLPEVYRAEDSTDTSKKGPLREMVQRIGVQAAVLRRSIDRMWEDQSIETCDDWVIAYVGDLLATNLVASLDARGQRLDVARTIHYRRRKGTLAVLEQIASDLTGWDARVVEFFRRMARARHGLDPEIGWPADSPDPEKARKLQAVQRLVGRLTHTTAGGFADLRSPHGARLTGTAFDEFSYTADMRVGRGHTGWYNIPRLGVFLWRLHSLPLEAVTPVQVAGCPNEYTFDPTGRRSPLFAASARTYGDEWISPDEHQLPGPISRLLMLVSLEELYAAVDPAEPTAVEQRSFGIFRQNGDFVDLIPVEHVMADPGADPGNDDKKIYIDPEQGVFFMPANPDPPIPGSGPLRVAYHHGFPSTIGAGAYDRRVRGQVTPPPTSAPIDVKGGGSALATALTSSSGEGTVLLRDSLTYGTIVDVNVTDLVLKSENRKRPLVRLTPEGTLWSFTGASGSSLVLDGIFMSGGEIVLKGTFESVVIVTSTLDPGNLDPDTDTYESSVDGRLLAPCRLRIEGQVRSLTIDRSITGPIVVAAGGAVEHLLIRDSIVQSLGAEKALSVVGTGEVEIERATILGPGEVHRLHASDTIFHDVMTVADTQHGCVRFSAWAEGSMLPRRYHTQSITPAAPIFTSTRFGQPGYAQLALSAPAAITEGGTEGSEPGAFWREKNAIKERSLRIRYQEYVPVGLAPVFIYVT